MATKSNNTEGNPWHDDKGKFTSPGNAGESSFNAEYDRQNTNIVNPKMKRLESAIKKNIPYQYIGTKDKGSLRDYLIFSKSFYDNLAPQIMSDLSERYVNTMMNVKQAKDDEKGNDFFIFNKNGDKEGIDLKTFSSQNGTIKISLKHTIRDERGALRYTDGYFLDKNKTNQHYVFQTCNYDTNLSNVDIYKEAQEGKDPSQHVSSSYAYFFRKKYLKSYFAENGLDENSLRELSENTLKQQLDDAITFINKHPERKREELLNAIYKTFGSTYSNNRIEKDYGGFKVVCEINNTFGHNEYESYIELNEDTLNDMDDIYYYEYKKSI